MGQSRARTRRRTRTIWLRLGRAAVYLHFDHVFFRALYKCDDLVTFRLGDLEGLQSGVKVSQEYRPIGFTDFHPLMGGLHISSGVVQRAACTRTQEINQELLLPL